MGVWVHIHVCFECRAYDRTAALARKYLPTIADEYVNKEAIEFLQDLSQRSGEPRKMKSGMYLWGYVGNYTLADAFVEVLKPFWEELLQDPPDHQIEWDGPFAHQRILVFYQREEKPAAGAYEIYWDDNDSPSRTLLMKHHEQLPFSWGT